MKFFLLGEWRFNTGPCNVNRSFVENADKSMRYLTWKRFGRIERWIKCLCSNPVVISGGTTTVENRILKLFHKKVIYLLHGLRRYENKVNNLNLSNVILQNEAESLKFSDIILPVSRKYSEWVKKQLPEYTDKISYLNNGVNISRRGKKQKQPFTIAISGGNRRIKNNAIVCQAVAKLIEQGYDCKVYVFGRFYPGGEDLSKFPFIITTGHLEKEKYYDMLDRIALFVMNSELESFGLVAADAINCNCSLLMAHDIGALSIIREKEDCDIIYDKDNVEEVASKMLKLLIDGNADRIYNSIDIEDASEKTAFLKLKNIAKNLLAKS